MIFLCTKIFLARIIDVSLGTLRTIITVKGKIFLASLIGFIEICVWFTVVKDALNAEEKSIFIMFSYAAGFALGTYLGGIVSSKLIKLNYSVQVITNSINLPKIIRKNGYGVSVIDVEGHDKKDKFMLLIQIKDKSLEELKTLIKKNDKKAFIIINETRFVQNGFIK
jgi:uncharacterized protein YebE (UPF0316 family)